MLRCRHLPAACLGAVSEERLLRETNAAPRCVPPSMLWTLTHMVPFYPPRPLCLPVVDVFLSELQTHSASTADVHVQLLTSRELAGSETRKAMEEFTHSMHQRAAGMREPSGARGGSAPAVAAAAAAAAADAAAATATATALGMPPSGNFGFMRSRPLASSASASAGGVAGEEPWLSLRRPQWNRQSGVSMSSGRAGREALGRSSASSGRR